MFAKAYLLVETDVGETRKVADDLKKVAKIKSFDAVTGPYDIIAIIEGKDIDDIGDFVTDEIRQITGITRIITSLAYYK